MLCFCASGLTQGFLTVKITIAPLAAICFLPCEQKTVVSLLVHTPQQYEDVLCTDICMNPTDKNAKQK